MHTLLSMIGPWQIILLLLVGLFLILFPILALIDILRHEFKGNDKIIWVLVVLFFPFFGTILYYFIGTRQKMR